MSLWIAIPFWTIGGAWVVAMVYLRHLERKQMMDDFINAATTPAVIAYLVAKKLQDRKDAE